MIFTLFMWVVAICAFIFLVQLIGILAVGIVIIALMETGHTYWAAAIGVVLVIFKAMEFYDEF
jgi:hypothetical protein